MRTPEYSFTPLDCKLSWLCPKRDHVRLSTSRPFEMQLQLAGLSGTNPLVHVQAGLLARSTECASPKEPSLIRKKARILHFYLEGRTHADLKGCCFEN